MKKRALRPVSVIGYVFTDPPSPENVDQELDRQQGAIVFRVAARSWRLGRVFADTGPRTQDLRPGLAGAIAAIECGEAEVLMYPWLDRKPSATEELRTVLQRARERKWTLMLADSGQGYRDPSAQGLLHELVDMERAMIAERAADAFAATDSLTHRAGRRRSDDLPDEIVARIVREREYGTTWQAIADGLTADLIPTARGGQWHATTVSRVYQTYVERPDERDARRRRHSAWIPREIVG